MCGIAGVLGGPNPGAAAERMSRGLAHRGPDGAGECSLGDAGGALAGALAHRRLSIIDLSAAGDQPMESADGRFVTVFNGEIYNYRELAAELRRDGAPPRGAGDTAALIEGWSRYGPDVLRRLRGMFAFALWDRARGRLVLARDEFGIKPLYVARGERTLVFASEIRVLLGSGLVEPRIDARAIAGYLAFGSAQEPRTMIEGVEALAPGVVHEFWRDEGGTIHHASTPFADLGAHAVEPVRGWTESVRVVRAALHDSVAHHLVSDVPIAFFLSGGIDSSAVVAVAAQQSELPPETFTIVFDEPGFSEAVPALAVARRYGTRHHQVPLSGEDLLGMLPAALAAMDQPSMDGLNTYAVSKAVRDHGLRVVLSGLGGDELFGGYPSFARARFAARVWWGARLARPVLAAAGRMADPRWERLAGAAGARTPEEAAVLASRTLFTPSLVAALGHDPRPEPFPATPRGLAGSHAVSWHELTGYMRNTLLRDSDVFSMAHGLELRVPFVDRGMVAAARAVDPNLLVAGPRVKGILVGAVEDLLPREVWDRPKQGFALPFARWLRVELAGEVGDALSSPARAARVGLEPGAVREVWRRFREGRPGYGWSRPWALYTLVRWAEITGAEYVPGREPRVAAPLVASA
ncbi:MAG TPA: asparagine synthase (glutamine-hydrolyzing) [Gemmatimonadaceae bacterium]|nr:asparagine synthase (glutamine-hydrolyzing) [Gemmatimonadaceae bacterium]